MRAPTIGSLPHALALAIVAGALARAPVAGAQPSRPSASDLERARTLDHEGARAFREGRYNDAIRYFDGAYKLGAPSIELWNIARCHLKLDEPEEASKGLERFLAQPDLTAEDRAEARSQLAELHRRRSTLTVTSSPSGAEAFVDGRPVGRTPTSSVLLPGEHAVVVRRGRVVVHEERVTARFGRAVIVDAQIPVASTAVVERSVARFESTAQLGLFWSWLGRFPGPAHPAGLLGVGYVLHDGERVVVVLGVRASLTEDTWGDAVGAAATGTVGPQGTCTLPSTFEGTALSAFFDGTLGYRVSRRLRLDADFGFGVAGYFADKVGGDVFQPSCSPAPGVTTAMLLGGSVSYAVTPALRITAAPLWFELQPAFYGARSTPIDAAGPWVRYGGGLGVALDL